MQNFYEGLCGVLSEHQVKTDEPMKKHTTFRIGGAAAFYVMPETAAQITGVTALCRQQGIPYYVLGNGSNLLVSDSGFDGVVIAMEKHWGDIRWEGQLVTAGAGALLGTIARQALERSLTGMEFAAGIPGTLGGAVVMNAGAYGCELKDILHSVTVLTADGEIKRMTAADLALGYRTSCIPGRNYIVLAAQLELESGTESRIRGRMEELAGLRRARQPLDYPSAGSTFKRPEGYFAGKLIQEAGLKGYQIGGAQVSDKHSGFVVNKGDATAADVIKLCRYVQAEVENRFGVQLELEIKTLGELL